MAATKTASKPKKKKSLSANDLIQGYKEYILSNGKPPVSVFLFTKELGCAESDFYEFFGSFTALEKQIWKHYLIDVIDAIQADTAYADYSVRERMLSFYFALFEHLKTQRSFISHSLSPDKNNLQKGLSTFSPVKDQFLEYVQNLVNEGFASGEIEQRPIISDRYKDGLWLQFVFLVGFWLKDDSVKFETTDAAVEKSVNLAFELMASGPLDQLVDFTKFIWQNR